MKTTNLTLTSADTQYSHTLQNDTAYWTVQCRTSAAVRMAEVTGKVAGPTADYATIKADGAFEEYRPPYRNQVVYFASSSAGVVLEIIETPA